MRETMAGPETRIVSRHDGPPDVVEFRGNIAAFGGGDVMFEKRVEPGDKAEAEAHARNEFMLQRTVSDGVTEGQVAHEDLGTSTIEGLPQLAR